MPSPSGPIGVILTDSCFAPPLPSTGEPPLMPRVCEESIEARQFGSMDGHGIPGACGNNGATPFACCKVIVSSVVGSQSARCRHSANKNLRAAHAATEAGHSRTCSGSETVAIYKQAGVI